MTEFKHFPMSEATLKQVGLDLPENRLGSKIGPVKLTFTFWLLKLVAARSKGYLGYLGFKAASRLRSTSRFLAPRIRRRSAALHPTCGHGLQAPRSSSPTSL
jgi:hypothetical protein